MNFGVVLKLFLITGLPWSVDFLSQLVRYCTSTWIKQNLSKFSINREFKWPFITYTENNFQSENID